MGCHTVHNNNEIFKHLAEDNESKCRTKLLFICVKPNVFKASVILDMDQMQRTVDNLVIVSVMAGISIAQIKECFRLADKTSVKCVRLMPNTATAVCQGICGLAIDQSIVDVDELKLFLTKILSLIGLCEFVTEQQINAVCGLGGSGIAFVSQIQFLCQFLC